MVSSSLFRLDPSVVGVILVMGIATYVTKAGGLWLLGRVDVSDRVEAGLEVLPGAIVVSILGPTLVDAGSAGWSAAVVALLVAWKSESVLLTIIAGVGAVVFFRTV
jgi:uncharacterized membrane protein